MTVVELDAQIFVGQPRGGISRYFVELMGAFDEHPELGVEVSMPFRAVVNEHLVEASPDRFRRVSRGGRQLRRVLDAGARRRAPRPSIRHYTFYEADWLRDDVPAVSTVHDMLPELMPELFPAGNPHRAKADYVRASRGVVCVSETTRRDLLATYGDLDAAIAVTPLGVRDEFRTPRPPRVALPAEYVLYVGARGGYKDFDVLARALAATSTNLDLVCVGGGAFSGAEHASLDDLGLGGRAHQLSVSDADLPGVYAAARVFAFPSRYEGFGLPLVEAMAAGAPVLAADTDVFREVADDAVVLVPPRDEDAWIDALARVASDASLRSQLTEQGRRRAAEFTWQRTAERTAALYREVQTRP